MSITANTARFRRAYLAGFALVILTASLAEAEYGPRTKIGANYQQSSTTTSVNGIVAGTCSVGECAVLFQGASAQKALIVQHVACRVGVSTGGLAHGYLRTRKGSTFPLRFTHFVPVNTTGNVWVVNSPVMHLVESGERPLIVLSNSAAADWTAECTISGKLQ
jgi:hypothetical protein